MSNGTHKPLVTWMASFKIFVRLLHSTVGVFNTQITYCHHNDAGQLSSIRWCYQCEWPGEPTTNNTSLMEDIKLCYGYTNILINIRQAQLFNEYEDSYSLNSCVW